jgi:hypothetical protein
MEPTLPQPDSRGGGAYTPKQAQAPTPREEGSVGAQDADTGRTARDWKKIASGHLGFARDYKREADAAKARGDKAEANRKLELADARMEKWAEAMENAANAAN